MLLVYNFLLPYYALIALNYKLFYLRHLASIKITIYNTIFMRFVPINSVSDKIHSIFRNDLVFCQLLGYFDGKVSLGKGESLRWISFAFLFFFLKSNVLRKGIRKDLRGFYRVILISFSFPSYLLAINRNIDHFVNRYKIFGIYM